MAFEELLRKISPKLKGITHKLGRYCVHIGEDDLYQEALTHLWLDHKDGRFSDKTDSYILQGCYFYLRNLLRVGKDRAVCVSIDEIIYTRDGRRISVGDTVPAEEPCIRDDANAHALIDRINNNGLTSREKEVFNLVLLGLTTREIGSRLGISHVRVVNLQKNIREKCKKHLDRELP